MRIGIAQVGVGSVAALGLGLALTACGTAATGAAGPAATGAAGTGHADSATQVRDVQTARSVFVNEEDPQGTTTQRPAQLYFYENTELDGITWTSWGDGTARGTGVLSDNPCDPDCATGHHDTYTAQVELSDIKTVAGKPQYTRYTVTFQGQASHPALAKALTGQEIKPA